MSLAAQSLPAELIRQGHPPQTRSVPTTSCGKWKMKRKYEKERAARTGQTGNKCTQADMLKVFSVPNESIHWCGCPVFIECWDGLPSKHIVESTASVKTVGTCSIVATRQQANHLIS
eukprot:358487-Chlamydomonas_euryale.AAC.12